MKLNVYATRKKYQPRLRDLNGINEPAFCDIRLKTLYLKYFSLWIEIFHTYMVYPSLKIWHIFCKQFANIDDGLVYFLQKLPLSANFKCGNTNVNKGIPNNCMSLNACLWSTFKAFRRMFILQNSQPHSFVQYQYRYGVLVCHLQRIEAPPQPHVTSKRVRTGHALSSVSIWGFGEYLWMHICFMSNNNDWK